MPSVPTCSSLSRKSHTLGLACSRWTRRLCPNSRIVIYSQPRATQNQFRSERMPIQERSNRGSGVILRSFVLGAALLVAGAVWFVTSAAPKPKLAADASKEAAADDLQ